MEHSLWNLMAVMEWEIEREGKNRARERTGGWVGVATKSETSVCAVNNTSETNKERATQTFPLPLNVLVCESPVKWAAATSTNDLAGQFVRPFNYMTVNTWSGRTRQCQAVWVTHLRLHAEKLANKHIRLSLKHRGVHPNVLLNVSSYKTQTH